MEGFKEFQGKDLDAAIREACEYYAVPREKLEIDIVQDAKSGIFGIVGARKAKIQARRTHVRETVEGILGRASAKSGSAAAPVNAANAGSPAGVVSAADASNAASSSSSENPQGAQRGGRDGGKKRSRGGRDERFRTDAVSEEGACLPENAAEKTAPTQEPVLASAAEGAEKAVNTPVAGAEKNRPSRENRPPREDKRESRSVREDRPRRAEKAEDGTAAAVTAPAATESGETDTRAEERSRRSRGRRRPERGERPERSERQERGEAAPRVQEGMPRTQDGAEDADESAQEGFRVVPLAELDAEKLRAVALEVVGRLISPVVDDVNLQVELTNSRVNVMVDCGDASGLLIGREGQTLASLQYLASRIVSRQMDAAVRVHLDAGAYRQRQDEKLRDMALALAERVRASGRSCSTRPLSSYHRRIVHLALQEMEDIQTRSSGDGSMKRVVILRKKQVEKTEKIAD